MHLVGVALALRCFAGERYTLQLEQVPNAVFSDTLQSSFLQGEEEEEEEGGFLLLFSHFLLFLFPKVENKPPGAKGSSSR